MKRSETAYSLLDLDFAKGLNNAWEKGWLDEFSADHFLIKAIEGLEAVWDKLKWRVLLQKCFISIIL